MKIKKIFIIVLSMICFFIGSCNQNRTSKGSQNHEERDPRRIYIQDNYFVVDNGKRIWINGANTPWNNWNEFGGTFNYNLYDDQWWNEHFAALRENGVNATRVWINCNNDNHAIIIDEAGMISGATAEHWRDLDLFFSAAERHKIYIMATLTSFDHFKERDRPDFAHLAFKWRNMILSAAAIDSFVANYTIPFVNRYKNNPYLWSIDVINEPCWVYENAECGKMSWNHISNFIARNAAAIHENSQILVTVGMAFPKYNADGAGYGGNKVSNAFLQLLYANKSAYLDFWSPHYYDWVSEWFGTPFPSTPSGPRSQGGWGLDGSKPAIIGESSANGSAGSTLTDDFINLYNNGWQGLMPWTSNGVDGNGGFNELIPATRHIAALYPKLVFPLD